MKKIFNRHFLKGMLSIAIIVGFAGGCFAWDDELAGTTEITLYYQQYRDFSFETGVVPFDFSPTRLSGGGLSVAQNIAEWFALWTQLSVYGAVDQWTDFGGGVHAENKVRILNNLQGVRYQTRQYGPFRFYGKAGAGVSIYNFSIHGSGASFSAAYGGGANIWLNRNIGITLDASHVLMSLPNVTDMDGRERFDSGMTYTTGLTFRF